MPPNTIAAGIPSLSGGTLEFDGGIAAGGTSLIDVQSGTATFKTTPINKTEPKYQPPPRWPRLKLLTAQNTVGAMLGRRNHKK